MTIRQFEQTNYQECIAYLSIQYKDIYVNIIQMHSRIMDRLKYKLHPKQEYTVQEIWDEVYRVVDQELKERTKLANKNFGLTKDDFELLKSKLIAGDESLFRHIFLNRFKACEQFLIKNCNATPCDAYDVTIESIIKFRKLIINDKIKYGNLKALLFMMLKHLYLDWIKKSKSKNSTEEKFLKIPAQTPDEEAGEKLDFALSKMCAPCRLLLRQHYYDNISLKILAKRMDKSEEAVRKQKQRCIEKLRNFLKSEKRDERL